MIRDSLYNNYIVQYTSDFKDVKNIVDTLTYKELDYICADRNFKDSPYVVYRKVLKINDIPVSFIDIYRLPDMQPDEGVIVTATKARYRNHGFAKLLFNQAKRECGIKNLIWKAKKDNDVSISMAKHLNFIKAKDTTEDTVFFIINEAGISRSSIKSKYLEDGDSCYNLDKWTVNGENILFVTGISGAGKTTLAIDLAQEFHCKRIELDYISCYYLEKQYKYNTYDKFYNRIKNDCPEAANFFDKNPIKKYGVRKQFEDTFDIVLDFINWFYNSFHANGNLYIINGAHIGEIFDVEFFKNKPLILKDINYIKTVYRKTSREFYHDDTTFLMKLHKAYRALKFGLSKQYRDINKLYINYRDELNSIITKEEANMFFNKSLNESVEIKQVDIDGDGSPDVLEIKKETNVPNVYFTKDITPESICELVKLVNTRDPRLHGNIAVKVHSGEDGNKNFLGPDLYRNVIEEFEGTVVECNTAYEGKRNNTRDHRKVMKKHKWDEFDVDIMDAEDEISLEVKNPLIIKENIVGSHLSKYTSMLVLSHFKGHAMAGYGGALKNISIGIASANGKKHIHRCPPDKMVSANLYVNQEEFLAAMADAASSVYEYFQGNMIFVNVMKNISVDCDCDAHAHAPCMDDIGVLVSTNPVAVDKACLDIIYNWNLKGSDKIIERIQSRNGLNIIKYMHYKGYDPVYNLINLDTMRMIRANIKPKQESSTAINSTADHSSKDKFTTKIVSHSANQSKDYSDYHNDLNDMTDDDDDSYEDDILED